MEILPEPTSNKLYGRYKRRCRMSHPQMGLGRKHKILRFVFRRSCVLSSEDLTFCLQKILCFVFRRSCVLSSEDLAFLSSEDLAFCLQRSCVLLWKHCVLSTSKILRFVSETLRLIFKNLAFCLRNAAFCLGKEAIHLILTRIGDGIYSTVDACQIAQEMWEAIKRLQQGESLNIQDVKTNLFWEFGKFTSHDGETMESYYTRFYKLMNEMIRNNLTVSTMQVHVQFLQQLLPEWSRSHTTTRHKGKEIAKLITPPSETASEEDNDPKQAQMDKDMQNNLARIAKYFKNIYKPTNNNLLTSSNSRNNNADTIPRYKNDNQSGQFENQRKECRTPKRLKDFAYHKEKMLLYKQAEQGVSLQVEQYDWLADTDEEINEQELEAHYSYMEKIQEVPTADTCTDSEPEEHVQNDAGYIVFANDLQHSEQSESVSNTCLVETDDSNVILDSPDMCEDDIQNEQNDVESDDERVALANLIVNLKLDNKQNEFEKYKAFNDRTVDYEKLELKLNETLGQLGLKDIEIKEGLKTKAYEISTHMTGNLNLLCNFVEKFRGTIRFGNDQFAPILGYGDLVQGNVTINRVYYVEGLNHNLFSVGQFCDADLEVAFRKSTCFVRDSCELSKAKKKLI
nr:integrase, catalytic region, zinc finger, CCHC-type, peptidase aspartic, catalytic [Tanacetum cinerariifolium]